MAGVHPPRSRPPTPSASTYDHTTAPDRPKLRNSCHACASSKLKCSQEKPTCSRCARRSLTCEYVAAKRGGRKPNSRSSISENRGNGVSKTKINAKEDVQLPSQANWFAPSTNASTDPLCSAGVLQHSTKTNLSGSADMLQDLFGSLDQTLSSTSPDTETDLNDLFTSPMSFSAEMADMADVNIFGTADFFSTGIDSSSNGSDSFSEAFPVFQDAVSELFALSIPSSTSNISTPSSKDPQNYQEVRVIESPCSCLLEALRFMKQLSSPPSNACRTLATQTLDKTTAVPMIPAVIAQNDATIEAVSVMLNCSCSQDGYLLAIMSLIIFKVLGWYAAVARKTPRLEGPQACRSRQSSPTEQVLENPTVVGSYCLDGADSARMAAQLVLSQLHRVRRLVDQLSSKLKLQAAKRGGGGGGAETPMNVDMDNEMALPLSAIMCDQFDVDLKNQLRALSLEMIDRLRRF